MRRAFIVAWALLLAGIICIAQSSAYVGQSRDSNYNKSVGSSLDPATTAWVNAVVTAGGTVSGAQQTRVNTLITCYKTNSIWSTVKDREWLLAAENTQQAKIDIVNLGTFTINGSPTFTAGHGYTGDGSAAYLDTGVNPSLGGFVFALNSAQVGVYVVSGNLTTSNFVDIGATDFSTTTFLGADGSLDVNARMNGGSGGPFNTVANTTGNWLFTRTASNLTTIYKNAASFATDSTASSAIPNATLAIFTENNGGHFSSDQISAAWIGGAMNSTQVTADDTCLNGGYMTSLGINVH